MTSRHLASIPTPNGPVPDLPFLRTQHQHAVGQLVDAVVAEDAETAAAWGPRVRSLTLAIRRLEAAQQQAADEQAADDRLAEWDRILHGPQLQTVAGGAR